MYLLFCNVHFANTYVYVIQYYTSLSLNYFTWIYHIGIANNLEMCKRFYYIKYFHEMALMKKKHGRFYILAYVLYLHILLGSMSFR